MPDAYKNTFAVPDSGEMPERWHRWLDGFLRQYVRAYAGRRFALSLGPPPRTLTQNAKLHAVLSDVARAFVEAGMTTMQIVAPSGEVVPLPVTMEAVKLFYKALYGPRDERGMIRSTASYTTTELSDFLDAVQNDPHVLDAGIYFEEA